MERQIPEQDQSNSGARCGVMWAWELRSGGAAYYDQEYQSKIESSFRTSPEGTATLTVARLQLELNFSSMCQTNAATGGSRRIIRDGNLPSICWFWRCFPGAIQRYAESTETKLEEMYIRVHSHREESTGLYDFAKGIYSIDFRQMTQTNVVTGTSRKIIRIDTATLLGDRIADVVPRSSFPSNDLQIDSVLKHWISRLTTTSGYTLCESRVTGTDKILAAIIPVTVRCSHCRCSRMNFNADEEHRRLIKLMRRHTALTRTAGTRPSNPFSPTSSSSSSGCLTSRGTPHFGENEGPAGTTQAQEETDTCPICLEELKIRQGNVAKLLKCGHRYHIECIEALALRYSYISVPLCPFCKTEIKWSGGTCPQGAMSWQIYEEKERPRSIPGHPNCGTIVIKYCIPCGTQTYQHPQPNRPFLGKQATAYLPDNSEGRRVLLLLKKAFQAGLTFTISRDTITNEWVVKWNSIPHKTNVTGGVAKFGYPDRQYFTTVEAEVNKHELCLTVLDKKELFCDHCINELE